MHNVRIFLEGIMAVRVDGVLLAAGVLIFLVGVVLLYKKGFWPWLPISISGILLVVVATLARLFSS
jgi:membrane-bound ClpP family serine protease